MGPERELRDKGIALPPFLERCVRLGLIERDAARRIDVFRRTSGLGLVGSIIEEGGVEGDARRPELLGESPPQPYSGPLLFPVPPNPAMTFASMVDCEANAFPNELAQIVASDAERRGAYNPLYIYGPVGSGKTHLLSAIANAAEGERVLLVNTEDLLVEHERAQKLGQRAELRQWIGAHDLMLIDDIQLCEGDEPLQRTLFSLFNDSIQRGKTVIIASDVPPTRLKGIETRLLSRLGSGVIVSLQFPDHSERREILRNLPGGEVIPGEVLDYLAERVTNTVRGLKAAGRQLIALASTTGVTPTPEMARALVPEPEDLMPAAAPAPTIKTGGAEQRAPEEDRGGAPERPTTADKVSQLKQMLAEAETEEEQSLALQIAFGERIRDLRARSASAEVLRPLERALEMLRQGQLRGALEMMKLL